MEATKETGLYRLEGGVVGGVCAGFADRFDMDVIVPRIMVVLVTLVTFGLGAIAYLVLWARLPERSLDSASDPYEVQPEYAGLDIHGEIASGASSIGLDGRAGGRRQSMVFLITRVAVAVCLAVLFLVVAAMVPPFIPGTSGWQLWPVATLVAGVFLAIVPVRSKREMAWHVIGIAVTSFSAMLLPMSLDLVSWNTIPFAFSTLWFLVSAGVIMLVIGIFRNDTAFLVGGSICLVVFCLFTLIFFSIPGEVSKMVFVIPMGDYNAFVF